MIEVLLDGDWVLYTAGFAGQKTEYAVVHGMGRADVYDSKRALNEGVEGLPKDTYDVFQRQRVDPLDHVLHTAKKMIESQLLAIEERFEEKSYVYIYLDGGGNFRDDVATIRPYKGNRKEASKPIRYDEIREYLTSNYRCVISDGCESDDMLATDQTRNRMAGEPSIIVGVDKDLLQVPGWHMNPNKGFKHISPAEGMGRLYRQAVMGDPVDNIAGAYKVGAKAAKEIIKPGMTELEMWEATVKAYELSIERFPDRELYAGMTGEQAALENMRLVYLRRQHESGLWQPPTER